jgi:hypothetical protein
MWRKLAAQSEVLCAECCFKRAFERGIDLTRANLRLCALNLAGWPFSYFNLFTDAKKQSAEPRPHIYEFYLKTAMRCGINGDLRENSRRSNNGGVGCDASVERATWAERLEADRDTTGICKHSTGA